MLLAGLVAVGLVALRPAATDERPRRPTDDGEVLERVVPRALALDGGAPAGTDAGTDAETDAGEGAP